MKPKLKIQDIYDTLPANGNYPGDIWHNLPFHGLVGTTLCSGIIVTPACDLANNKASTITYLPIIPISKFFSTVHFLGHVKSAIKTLLDAAKLTNIFDWPEHVFTPLPEAVIAEAERRIKEVESIRPFGLKEQSFIDRAYVGFSLLRVINGGEPLEVSRSQLEALFGEKRWNEIRSSIVRNSFSSDLHFLPCDGQDEEWSAVPYHSVVLFRCPVSAPAEIFDIAQDYASTDWPGALTIVEGALPIAKAFKKTRPVKAATLRPRFMADMTTRYVSLFSRLGSPDFTADTVEKFCSEIG
jgi:hypothetical protein